MSTKTCVFGRQAGLSLVELLVTIIVLSVGVVALLATMGILVRGSVEPMRQKQMTAIAESLMSEILHQPFTYCDPDDTLAPTAASSAGCTGGSAASQDVLGPTAGESRLGAPAASPAAGTQFDNVGDYHNYSVSPVVDITGNSPTALSSYGVSVGITQVGTTFGLSNNDALRVDVTVTRGSDSFTLTGYRFRYAPRY